MPKAAMKSWLRLSPALVTEGAQPGAQPGSMIRCHVPCAMSTLGSKSCNDEQSQVHPVGQRKKTRPVSHSFPKSQLRSSANNDGFNYGKNGDIIKNIYIYVCMYVMSICWEMMETEFQQSHDLGMPGWDHVEIGWF